MLFDVMLHHFWICADMLSKAVYVLVQIVIGVLLSHAARESIHETIPFK